MLNFYELYDLYSIFIEIRFSPDNAINSEVLLRVINILKNADNSDEPNQFRKAIQPICAYDEKKLFEFSLVENKYCYFPLPALKDRNIYLVLIKACEKLLDAVNEKNVEKIYDLSDCLHNLPIFISENKYTIPKEYWENEVRYYREKWDRSFLVEEQKGSKNET